MNRPTVELKVVGGIAEDQIRAVIVNGEAWPVKSLTWASDASGPAVVTMSFVPQSFRVTDIGATT